MAKLTGWKEPSSNAVYSTGTVAWTNPGNAYTQDGSDATVTLATTESSDTQHFYNFGFTSSDLPENASISFVEVEIYCRSGAGGGATYIGGRVLVDGDINGAFSTSSVKPITDTNATYDVNDAVNDHTITGSAAHNNEFGFALLAVNYSATDTVYVDRVRMRLSYNEVTTLRTDTTNSGITRASDVSTVTLSAAKNVQVGDRVVVSGCTPSSFDGTHTVTEVTSSTVFKFAQVGSDESTTTHGTTGGDYSLMSTWESTEQKALTTNTLTHTLLCYDDWASGLDDAVNIAGWVTADGENVIVKAAPGHGHLGVYGDGFTLADSTSWSGGTLDVDQNFTEVSGITITNTSSGTANPHAVMIGNYTGLVFDSLFLEVPLNSGSASAPFYSLLQQSAALTNCVTINGVYGYHIFTNTVGTTISNCTAIDATSYGFYDQDGTAEAIYKNCVSYGATTADFLVSANAGNTNNASEDTSAPGSNPVTGIAAADFVSTTNDNYKPSPTSDLYEAGADLSGTFTTDIRGVTRSYWSIGAYDTDIEYRTLRSADGDYTLMSTWESTEQADITSVGRHVLECYNDWIGGLDDELELTGWTTNATYFITIRAAAGQGHGGVFTGGFFMYAPTPTDFSIDCGQNYSVFEDLSLRVQGGNYTVFSNTATNVTIRRCIISQVAPTNSCNGINTTASDFRAENCLVVSDTDDGIGTRLGINVAGGPTNIENCTVVGFKSSGFDNTSANANRVWKNCVAYGNAGSDFTANCVNSTFEYNASEDATAVGTGCVTGVASTDFIDYANDNFRPDPAGALYGVGTDLSLGTDIRGETRDQWSIGAFDSDYVLRTLKSTGGDYSSITTWESTEQTDLTTSGDRHILECYDGTTTNGNWQADGSLAEGGSIAGWTTSAAYFVTVRAAAGEGHGGDPTAGFRLWRSPGDFVVHFGSTVAYTVFENLNSRNLNETTTGAGAMSLSTGTGQVAKNCIARASSNSTLGYAFLTGSSGIATYINCLAYNSHAGFSLGGAADGCTLQNCTSVGHADQGVDCGSADATLQNTVAYDNATADFVGTGTLSGSNNASEDTTAPGTSPTTGIASADFVDYANDNFRPDPAGALYGVGTDLSLGTDIRGETISEISIGAFDSDYVLRTLRSTGGDYSLMSTWESTEQVDLTSTGDSHILRCYNDWPSGLTDLIYLFGWTASSTYTITVEAATGEGHGGVSKSGFYLTHSNAVLSAILRSAVNYVTFRDIEVADATTSGTFWSACFFPSNTNIRLERCIFSSAGTLNQAIRLGSNGLYAENCLIYDGDYGVNAATSTYTFTGNNLTVVGANTGFGAGDYTLKNCVAYDNSTADYNVTTNTGSSDNASGDSSAIGTNPTTGVAAADFVDYAGGDYQPASTSTKLKGTGTDLSGTFTDDITGTTRVTWDIGAFIAEAAGGGWSVTDVDLDESIYDGQTGVVVTLTGTVSASGKRVWIVQSGSWVEQTVTGETASTITITVGYDDILVAGAATLYVGDPL